MHKHEWKKQFLYNRTLWIVIVFIVVELVSMILSTRPYDKELELNRDVYNTYLSEVVGPLTPEKRNKIETEMNRLDKVRREINSLKNRYYSGDISEKDYREQFEMLHQSDKLYDGYSKLYTQYIFVRENERRSFLYTGGWEVLLGDQNPDYFFLLFLIVALTPVFCEEYSSKMHEVLMTQKKSARHTVAIKLAMAITLTAVFSLIIQMFDIAYCAIKFGLPNGNFSLQSIMSYGTTAKEMTIYQAVLFQFAIKTFGYIYAAVIILFFSVFLKKYALTLMTSIAVLPLVFLTVNSNDVFVRLPGPWAFVLGSIYLNPTVSGIDKTGNVVVSFAEVTYTELFITIGISVLIIISMVFVIWQKNSNEHLKGSVHRTVKYAVLVCGVLLLFTGCTTDTTTNEKVIYNRSTASFYENADYVIIGNYDDSVLIDKSTNLLQPFPLDALAETTDSIERSFYYSDGGLYYKKKFTLYPRTGYDSITAFWDIVRLDLDTFEESVYYQWNSQEKWFFNLINRDRSDLQPISVEDFFIHGNSLFFYNTSGEGLCKMDLRSGKYEVYPIEMGNQDLAYDGENIYYTDSYNRLVIHNLLASEDKPIDDVVTEKFLLTTDGLFFSNRRDEKSLYHWDMQNGAIRKLSDAIANEIYWDGEYVWLFSYSVEGNKLFRVSLDEEEELAISVNGYINCVGEDYGYLTQSGTGYTLIMDKETIEFSPLVRKE